MSTDKELYDTIGNRGKSRLHEMAALGKEYREDMELEVFGDEIRIEHRALPDREFLPILASIADAIGLEAGTSSEEAIEEAMEEVDDARDEQGNIDITQLNEEFVGLAQGAAAKGITAAYDEDGEKAEIDEEEALNLMEDLVGGLSVEIGMRVLDTAGSVRDAELFR